MQHLHTNARLGAVSALFKPGRPLFAFTLVLVALVAVGSFSKLMRPAQAATFCVNPGGTGGCFATIQAAVTAADATPETDTINVAAGTYAEVVTIPASEPGLTINGPNANINPCTGTRVAEATVGTAGGAFVVLAADAVINGFTISGVTGGFNAGVNAPTASGLDLLNNIIENNVIGVSPGGTGILISGNNIRNNNNPGSSAGSGIYTDFGLTMSTITNNCFSNNLNVSSNIIGAPCFGAAITGNSVTNNVVTSGGPFYFIGGTNITVTGNTHSGGNSHAVQFDGGVNGATVSDNNFSNGAFSAVRISNFNCATINSNITINCNRLVNFGDDAIRVSDTAYDGVLNAENNFYGCNAGPNAAGCETVVVVSSGDPTPPTIDADPWLVLTLTASPMMVPSGGTSTLTASLNTNSNGTLTGCGIDGAPTTFASTCGTVNPAATTTTQGNATSTLTATGSGACTSSATIDSQTVTVSQQVIGCMLTCPTNVNVGVPQGQTGTTVTFAAPTTNGACGPVVCSPPSGSTFNVGTTVVTCRAPSAGSCSTAYGLTIGNALVTFDVATPGVTSAPVAIGGLGAGENVVGIDFRPANGVLYGVAVSGTTARLLTINPATGATAQVGATFPVTGSSFGVDFNPVPDRLRVVSDTDINLRINPDTGAVLTDGAINPSSATLAGAGYTNNFAGATTTTLYTIDSGTDQLFIQNPPNAGTQVLVGSLGVVTTGSVGFDVSQCNGIAYATLTPAATSNLYTINLATGAATLVGTVGAGLELRGFALGLTAPATQAMCSFNVTVNPVSFTVTDPAACTGPGGVVTGTFVIPNLSPAPVTVTGTVALPAGLVGIPGSGTTNVGTVTVTATTVSFSGTLAPGQTGTVTYQAQVGSVASGAVLCSNLTVTFSPGGGPPLTVQACVTVDCSAVGPGLPFPATSEVSDQKAGSVLVYNLYSSNAASPQTQNTRISITNTNPSLPIAVHLFFVDGATCSIADVIICLTKNQTASFLVSDLDPGTTGYIVAIASDVATGCPVNFNFLIGDEYVKLASGHAANLGAEAFSAIAGGPTPCDGNSVTAQLNFDGISYNRVPRTLAASSIPARADGNDTLLVVNRFGGNLAIGAGTLFNLFGIFYDDAENALSFTFQPGVCQFRSSLSNNFPRLTPRFETFIPAGRSGWLRLFSTSDIGLLGAVLNFNPNAGTAAGAFNQGRNLHKLTLTSQTLIIPIFPANCLD